MTKYYKNKHDSLKKKFLVVLELLTDSVSSGVGYGLTMSRLAPVGNLCARSSSFFSSISTLITNEYLSKTKKIDNSNYEIGLL